jgi:Ca2+-binding RTX toxin-like protein
MLLTDPKQLETWTNYLSSIVGFTGNPDIINGFSWTNVSTLTVEQYLALLDTAEAAFTSFNWSFLSAQLPFFRSILEGNGLPASVINQALGLIEDFIAGDLSLITDGFDTVRAYLGGFAPSTGLVEALSGAPEEIGIRVDGNGTDENIVGTAFDDRLFGNGGKDKIDAQNGADIVNGGNGNDRLFGGGGKDKMNGGGGRDVIKGGNANDTIKGGGGNDKIFGDTGADKLFGGRGADDFIFKIGDGRDVIKDFTVGKDQIDMAGVTIEDITISKKGADVLLTYEDIIVLVEDVTKAEMNDADNFL